MNARPLDSANAADCSESHDGVHRKRVAGSGFFAAAGHPPAIRNGAAAQGLRPLTAAAALVAMAVLGGGCADRKPTAPPAAARQSAAPAGAASGAVAALPVRVPPIEPGQLRVCAFAFHSPDELAALEAALPAEKFVFTDLSPELPEGAAGGDSTLARTAPGWFMERCRPDLKCDVVFYSGEFAGAFFGAYGTFVTMQEMEEASCKSQCDGLFRDPSEVFLFGCNTLATKSADHRTPEEYLNVLLAHGYSHTDAQRVVAARYGPLGPSFRDAMRRSFVGVPRIYGFSSVAPLGKYTAPRLREYFRRKGDYAEYLANVGRESTPNRELSTAFKGTALVQTAGIAAGESIGQDRALVCRLYDDDESVKDRLHVVRDIFERDDFLSFLPTVEVFFDRHPPARYSRGERRAFEKIQALDAPREKVTEMVYQSELSVLKMQMANLARQVGWITPEEHERVAAEGLKELLATPLSTEVADIGCELAQYAPTGTELTAGDIPDQLLWHSEGYRLLDCLRPADPQVSVLLLRGLENLDTAARAWALYALWHRRPLTDEVLIALAPRLDDPSADVSGRVRRIFNAEAPLSPEVLAAIRERDQNLADMLAQR